MNGSFSSRLGNYAVEEQHSQILTMKITMDTLNNNLAEEIKENYL